MPKIVNSQDLYLDCDCTDTLPNRNLLNQWLANFANIDYGTDNPKVLSKSVHANPVNSVSGCKSGEVVFRIIFNTADTAYVTQKVFFRGSCTSQDPAGIRTINFYTDGANVSNYIKLLWTPLDVVQWQYMAKNGKYYVVRHTSKINDVPQSGNAYTASRKVITFDQFNRENNPHLSTDNVKAAYNLFYNDTLGDASSNVATLGEVVMKKRELENRYIMANKMIEVDTLAAKFVNHGIVDRDITPGYTYDYVIYWTNNKDTVRSNTKEVKYTATTETFPY